MSIYSAFIYEKHNLPEYRPDWMKTERIDYCDQNTESSASFKGLLEAIGGLFRGNAR